MSNDLDAKVCRCGHTAYWHGASDGDRVLHVRMGQGSCDSCDCKAMDEVRTDSLSSLRHDLKHACELLERLLDERNQNCEVANGLAERCHHELHDYPAYLRATEEIISEDPETEDFLRAHGRLRDPAEHYAGELAKAEGENA